MGQIQEFANELRRRAKRPFAEWHTVDLHNHSPKSFDYRGKGEDLLSRTIGRIRSAGLSVVMFTDHGELPDAGFVQQVSEGSGALILRGVELNVFVDAWGKPEAKVAKEAFFHLLLGFDPDADQPPEYWLSHIYRECKEQERQAGSQKIRGIASTLDELFRVLKDSNAILIPAHLHSAPDAFESRSVDDIYGDAEFLRHARDHFTALDVTSDKTAAFFDGKHSETGRLHKTCIRSSDAHEPETLGTRPFYAQMQEPTFVELKAALELPFRTSRSRPEEPKSWVVGLHVDGAFLKDLWWSCSPHCNALIGVKGSGKTSVLECLRYVLGIDVPLKRKDTVSQHLDAILGSSGRVRVLLKREDGARVLVQRSRSSKDFTVTFEDDRTEAFTNPESFQFPAYVLGWHEIEQAAEDISVRRLYMDTIAGREQVRTLEQKAVGLVGTIRHKHDQASERYNGFRDLYRNVADLEELRRGLQELTDADLITLKDEFERASEHREQFDTARLRLKECLDGLPERANSVLPGLERTWFKGESPLAGVSAEADSTMKNLFAGVDGSFDVVAKLLATALAQVGALSAAANERFDSFSTGYRERIATLSDEHRRLLESHQIVTEKTKALPRLRAELDQKKADVEGLLSELAGLAGEVADTLDARSTLRQSRVADFNSEVGQYGVRLAVVAGIQSIGFQELTQRYRQGAEVLSRLPSASRLHTRLKVAYEGLRRNLVAGDHVFFDHAEFGYFLDVFEEDDLKVEFDVSAGAGSFRPIDQLSAGQRCTAIFPLLLKLRAGPLVIDQPEDNLDNRHIANSIAPALLEDKRTRQIVFTSHNANLVVLNDAESITSFESTGSEGRIEKQGFLATRESAITKEVLETLDGGERALELRYKKYGRPSAHTVSP